MFHQLVQVHDQVSNKEYPVMYAMQHQPLLHSSQRAKVNKKRSCSKGSRCYAEGRRDCSGAEGLQGEGMKKGDARRGKGISA